MKIVEFEMFKRKFADASDDEKITMYSTTEGLTKDQYMELLRNFPLNKLNELEEALK
ncbi:hypothetical protein NE664_11225 [Anaerotignum faecicola]|nr:hypothetical protein [Anaerotignum faecicola]